jgi:outer membrane immunogenic protein
VGRNTSGSLNGDGFTGGGQVGCIFQSAQFVWGVEGDINWFGQDARLGGNFLYSTNNAPYFASVEDHKKWLATVRGRLGYAFDRYMIYATGGLAIMKVDYTQIFNEPPFVVGPAVASFSETKLGWTVGGGAEAALGGCCWSVKAEFLYARFDSETVGSVVAAAPASLGRTSTFTNTVGPFNVYVARAGLNYRFGGL